MRQTVHFMRFLHHQMGFYAPHLSSIPCSYSGLLHPAVISIRPCAHPSQSTDGFGRGDTHTDPQSCVDIVGICDGSIQSPTLSASAFLASWLRLPLGRVHRSFPIAAFQGRNLVAEGFRQRPPEPAPDFTLPLSPPRKSDSRLDSIS